MSTIKVNSIEPANAGSEDYFLARAWVNFNGTGTVAIRDSGNVSSITDRASGRYTVNLTTALVDANYSASCTSNGTATYNSYILNGDNSVTPTSSSYGVANVYPGTGFSDGAYNFTTIFR